MSVLYNHAEYVDINEDILLFRHHMWDMKSVHCSICFCAVLYLHVVRNRTYGTDEIRIYTAVRTVSDTVGIPYEGERRSPVRQVGQVGQRVRSQMRAQARSDAVGQKRRAPPTTSKQLERALEEFLRGVKYLKSPVNSYRYAVGFLQ